VVFKVHEFSAMRFSVPFSLKVSAMSGLGRSFFPLFFLRV